MTFNRRMIMAGAGALAVAPALGIADMRPAAAAAIAQAPGIYRMKLGSFTVTAITDGLFNLPLQPSFIPNAVPAEIDKALEDAFLPKGNLPIPFTPLLVETGSKRILIDTGYGQSGPPSAGQLTANLKAAGVDPGAIDIVVISHFHPDHISGLRGKDGALTFPNAEIHVPAAEWDYWTDAGNAGKAPEGLKGTFAATERVFGPNKADIKRFAADSEVVTGIHAFAAYGHTPGHSILALESDGQKLMYLADVTNNPLLFARHPDWSPLFDQDAGMARATRHRILDMVSSERALVAGYHYVFPAVGHIFKTAAGYDVAPVVWNPTL